MMKKRLPEYVVNSFVAAGYDTLEVISELDVSDKPGNSLEEIEEFITKEHPDDSQFSRACSATSAPTCTFKLPPGHRKRVQKFVEDVKSM